MTTSIGSKDLNLTLIFNPSFQYINVILIKLVIFLDQIKLRMEVGNVSKRQQPDHRAENIFSHDYMYEEIDKICRFTNDY